MPPGQGVGFTTIIHTVASSTSMLIALSVRSRRWTEACNQESCEHQQASNHLLRTDALIDRVDRDRTSQNRHQEPVDHGAWNPAVSYSPTPQRVREVDGANYGVGEDDP